jgi:hypothetical protein
LLFRFELSERSQDALGDRLRVFPHGGNIFGSTNLGLSAVPVLCARRKELPGDGKFRTSDKSRQHSRMSETLVPSILRSGLFFFARHSDVDRMPTNRRSRMRLN